MKKTVKIIWTAVLVISMLILGVMLADKQYLQKNVIRLHVRANSDSTVDQQEKLAVRDVLLSHLATVQGEFTNQQEAKEFLESNLGSYENAVNSFLEQQGSSHQARISLKQEAFDTRDYDTFSLPAGVYDSLVVEIGMGEGKNWWCVVFPTLCLQDFYTAASAVNMDTDMQNTLTGEDGYEIRFFLLECIGKLENFFHKS